MGQLAALLLLDLLRYLVHRCEHAVPLFWRLHALHHSDPDVDVTTSVRHHPVEYLLTSAVRGAFPRYSGGGRAGQRARSVWHGCGSARQYPPTRKVGAVAAAGPGHGRHAPRPPFDRILARELELRRGLVDLGSIVWHPNPDEPSGAREDGLWRPGISATRLPEAVRDVNDPVAARPGGVREVA